MPLLSPFRKKPWMRIRPDGYISADGQRSQVFVSQYDFLQEYYPSGHRIHDVLFYPNVWRKAVFDLDDGSTRERYYEEQVPRIAFGFQKLIALKHTIHACGNDVQFDISKTDVTDEEKRLFSVFKNGWALKGMEFAVFNAVKSVLRTGDAAFVGIKMDGVFSWRTFSFLDGDELFPHYGPDGRLKVFFRRFREFDADGNLVMFCEAWDSRFYYRFRSSVSDGSDYSDDSESSGVSVCGFDMSGYVCDEVSEHGFKYVPVAYFRRSDGPCWSDINELVWEYEVAFSQMAQNNKAFGEPILVFKGDDISCVPNELTGTIKTIDMDSSSDVKYLEAQSASDSFIKQLETLYNSIFELSSTVQTPEVRSGDMPAATFKIVYSPAYEQSFDDCNELQPFIDDMVTIFKDGYGVETGNLIGFSNLPVSPWLKPYIHVNWSSMIADISSAVDRGYLSRQTASERISEYAVPDEFSRLLREEEMKAARAVEFAILEEKRKRQASISSSAEDGTAAELDS